MKQTPMLPLQRAIVASKPLYEEAYYITLFENYSKCRIWIFDILAFSTSFCPIKIDLSDNTVWQQTADFQKLVKMKIFGIVN